MDKYSQLLQGFSAQWGFSVDSPHHLPHRLTKYLSTTEHKEWQVIDSMYLST